MKHSFDEHDGHTTLPKRSDTPRRTYCDDYCVRDDLTELLREVIDGWVNHYLNDGPGPNADRIAEIRARLNVECVARMQAQREEK